VPEQVVVEVPVLVLLEVEAPVVADVEVPTLLDVEPPVFAVVEAPVAFRLELLADGVVELLVFNPAQEMHDAAKAAASKSPIRFTLYVVNEFSRQIVFSVG
jgi:hypothetical protein